MKSIFDKQRHAELVSRLDGLAPDSPRQWGSMTAHQAVCHLADSFKAVLGDRPLPATTPDLRHKIIRFVAFTLPLPWPKGTPTSTQVQAERGGTAPGDFAQDVAELRSLVERFVETKGAALAPHYVWGDMSRGEWGRYAYRHIDHHLRQFGA